MVKLHIKKGEESHFLYETNVGVSVEDLIIQIVRLYNGRLKVDRLCQGKLAYYINFICYAKSFN